MCLFKIKFRDARRALHFSFRRGRASADYCSEVTQACFRIFWCHSRGAFVARLSMFQREHTCAYRLVRIIWEQAAAASDSSFPSAKVAYSNMETPLSAETVKQLGECGVRLVTLGGFRHSRLMPPRPHGPAAPPVHSKIDRVVRSILFKDILQGVDNYVYSGDVHDLALQAQGFTELVARPAPDLGVFWDSSPTWQQISRLPRVVRR